MTRILFLQVIPYSTSFDATYLYFLLGFVVLIVLVVYANKYTQSRKDGSKFPNREPYMPRVFSCKPAISGRKYARLPHVAT